MLLKRKIRWDPDQEQIADDDEAAAMLRRPYRSPWHSQQRRRGPARIAGADAGPTGEWVRNQNDKKMDDNNLYDQPDVIRRHGFDEYLLWPGSLDRDRVTDAEYARFMERVLANDFAFTTEMIRRIESRYWDVLTLDHQGRRKDHQGRFGPDVFQEAAYDFIRRHKHRPFLLYLPSPLTHGWTFTDPVTPTPLNPDADRPHDAVYRDMIRYADLLVGRLVDHLRDRGILERTIICAGADNGSEKSFSARFCGRVVRGGLYQMTDTAGKAQVKKGGEARRAGAALGEC